MKKKMNRRAPLCSSVWIGGFKGFSVADGELWPFLFDVNLIQRKALRERTVFVTIEEGGMTRWTDHSGRFGRRGGFGGFTIKPGGEIRHFRGDRELSPGEEEPEREEFTVKAELADADFRPIRSLIERVGKPWLDGWDSSDSETLHELLENVYWKHINRLMYAPLDDQTDT